MEFKIGFGLNWVWKEWDANWWRRYWKSVPSYEKTYENTPIFIYFSSLFIWESDKHIPIWSYHAKGRLMESKVALPKL